METAKRLNGWIHSPGIDLVFFSFGWLPLLALFYSLQLGNASLSRNSLILTILFFNFLHRHLTFPLVYGDPQTFSQKKKTYLVLPLIFLGITLVSLLHLPLFKLLVVISVLWTIYHTVMQKLGILRFYSRRAGYGVPRVDRFMILSWFVTTVLLLGASQKVRGQAAGYAVTGAVLKNFFEVIEAILPVLVGVSVLVSLVATVLYIRQEYHHRDKFSWPRNLYLVSILSLYLVFGYDLLVGYAVFGFSHSIEYLAFVNVYARNKFRAGATKKSLMGWAVQRQVITFGIFCLVGGLIFVFWQQVSAYTLNIYIVGSSFLHFLYDGWIWKFRKAKVGEPMGLTYATATP